MASEFCFRLSPDRLRIEDRKSGARLELPNQVVVEKRRGLILSLGEEESVVRARFGQRLPSGEIAALTVFGQDGTLLAYELRVIGHLIRLLAREPAKGRSSGLLASRPPKGSDFILEVPGYEAFPADRRQSLEDAVQAQYRVRRLVINGKDVEIPPRRRGLEILLWRWLVIGLPILAAIIGLVSAPAAVRAERLSLALYVLAVVMAVYYAGKVAWMLLARRVVPARYCRYLLVAVRRRHSPIDRWLAEVVWRRESSK